METVLHRILFVLSEGCSWRAVDGSDANWNSIYQYWRRWCQQGIWAELLDRSGPELKGNRRFVDSTHVKVHRDGCNPAGGQGNQGMGRTKGGLNTKIHAVVDAAGRPAALLLGAGNEADVSRAQEILGDVECGQLVGDKGYDSDELRQWLRNRSTQPCIPPRSNRLRPEPYSKAAYRKRHLIENFFEKLKRFRRIATRYDKLAVTFFGFVCLAATVSFTK
jgi:transposase